MKRLNLKASKEFKKQLQIYIGNNNRIWMMAYLNNWNLQTELIIHLTWNSNKNKKIN